MSFLVLAWRYVRWRVAASLVAVGALGTVVAVLTTLLGLPEGLRAGLEDLPSRFPLIVGRGESDDRLVLALLFFALPAPPPMERDIYDELRARSDVRSAIPILLDSSIQGHVRIRTRRDLFERLSGRVELESGRFFMDSADYDEVVVGAAASPADDDVLVGRLRPTGTPVDEAIFSALRPEDPLSGVLVVPADGFRASALRHQALHPDVRVVSTRMSVEQIFRLVGAVDELLEILAAALTAALACSLGLSFYGAALERRRDLAVLRAIGASRTFVFGLLLSETAILAVLGIVIGLAGTALLATIASSAIRTAGLPFAPDIASIAPMIGGAVFVGVLIAGGLAPALQAYRIDPIVGIGSAHRPWSETFGPRARLRFAWLRLAAVFLIAFVVPTAIHKPTPPHHPIDAASRELFRVLRSYDQGGNPPGAIASLDGKEVEVSGYIDVPPGTSPAWRTRFELVAHDPNHAPELFHSDPILAESERIVVTATTPVEPTLYPVRVKGVFRLTGDPMTPYAVSSARVLVLSPTGGG